MSNEHKKVCTTLNYIEPFLVLVFAITGCVTISAFASLFGVRIYELCNRIKKLCNNCGN